MTRIRSRSSSRIQDRRGQGGGGGGSGGLGDLLNGGLGGRGSGRGGGLPGGKGGMGGYGAVLPVRDRWAIIAYVRALQTAFKTPVADAGTQDSPTASN